MQSLNVESNEKVTGIIAGMRWDLLENTAFKVDLHNQTQQDHAGEEKDDTLLTVGMDMIF